jgi:tetratricopeptide (TPR) repeat protein
MDQEPESALFLQTLAEAQALTAAGEWSEAVRHWERVVVANPVEGRFWTHLAEAHDHTNAYRSAAAAYERAFALRDGYPAETAYHLARCYARLDELTAARDWLTWALDLGLRNLVQVQTDDALARLREDEEIRERIGLLDTDGLSRDAGWRADLRFLAREVRRRAYMPFQASHEEPFDVSVDELIRAIPDLSDAQIIIQLTRLLFLLRDGHAAVSPPRDYTALPVQFYLFAEGLFIVAADPEHEDLLGAQVLQFDDHAVEEVIAVVEPLLPRDNGNSQWPQHLLPRRLQEPVLLHALGLTADPHRVALTLRDRDGAVRTGSLIANPGSRPRDRKHTFPCCPEGWVRFPATLPAPLPSYLRNVDVPYWFEYLPDDRLVYLQFNAVQDHPAESLSDFSKRIFGFTDDHVVDKLVIDIRWNGGGNTFLLLPLLHRLIGSPLNTRGRLFVIIGRGTFSAAQNFTSLLEKHTAALFVGEPTGSSPTFVGETVEFELPYSKTQVNVSDLLWQGTWPMDYRIWIAPALYAPPTFSAFRENRDPALEAIMGSSDHLPGS